MVKLAVEILAIVYIVVTMVMLIKDMVSVLGSCSSLSERVFCIVGYIPGVLLGVASVIAILIDVAL